MQLKLRDIEVANDDFERQARNTTSSLEDLESKYNVAIERAVLLEEEIKIGEQERERLRVEAQRLKEELSDLRIEADILQDKIKKQEERRLGVLSIPASPAFAHSPNSTASSPLILTPPDTKSISTAEALSHSDVPPSPPMSDVSAPLPRIKTVKTPATAARKSRLPSADHSITPKPKQFASSPKLRQFSSSPKPRQFSSSPKPSQFSSSISGRAPGTRVATMGSTGLRTPGPRVPPAKTPRPTTTTTTSQKPATAASLTHIRSLTAQMQRLEARVQSARSKLPAPVGTPSPRGASKSSGAGTAVPSTVTVRSRKRTAGSTASSMTSGPSSRLGARHEDATPTIPRHRGDPTDFRSSTTTKAHVPRLSTSGTGVSRLSFGTVPNRNPTTSDGASESISRPSSRASISSYVSASGIARPASRTDSYASSSAMPPPHPRPMSRTSLSGARTPLGVRPRSSLGGSIHEHRGHGHSQSVSYSTAEMDELAEDMKDLKIPSRRGTFSRYENEIPAPPTAIPAPGRRQSGASVTGRRTSGMESMLEDVGETY